jgi:hypothetical protein
MGGDRWAGIDGGRDIAGPGHQPSVAPGSVSGIIHSGAGLMTHRHRPACDAGYSGDQSHDRRNALLAVILEQEHRVPARNREVCGRAYVRVVRCVEATG